MDSHDISVTGSRNINSNPSIRTLTKAKLLFLKFNKMEKTLNAHAH